MRRPVLLLAGLLLLNRGAGAQGRPLTATGTQQLSFNMVFPGLVSSVLRTDAVNAGRFDLRGTNRAEVSITLTLPPVLAAAGGRTIPLLFGPNDGGFNQQNLATSAQAFDPRVPLVTRLANNGRLFIYLGGSVSPSATASAGTYQATITLTSAYTGNE